MPWKEILKIYKKYNFLTKGLESEINEKELKEMVNSPKFKERRELGLKYVEHINKCIEYDKKFSIPGWPTTNLNRYVMHNFRLGNTPEDRAFNEDYIDMLLSPEGQAWLAKTVINDFLNTDMGKLYPKDIDEGLKYASENPDFFAATMTADLVFNEADSYTVDPLLSELAKYDKTLLQSGTLGKALGQHFGGEGAFILNADKFTQTDYNMLVFGNNKKKDGPDIKTISFTLSQIGEINSNPEKYKKYQELKKAGILGPDTKYYRCFNEKDERIAFDDAIERAAKGENIKFNKMSPAEQKKLDSILENPIKLKKRSEPGPIEGDAFQNEIREAYNLVKDFKGIAKDSYSKNAVAALKKMASSKVPPTAEEAKAFLHSTVQLTSAYTDKHSKKNNTDPLMELDNKLKAKLGYVAFKSFEKRLEREKELTDPQKSETQNAGIEPEAVPQPQPKPEIDMPAPLKQDGEYNLVVDATGKLGNTASGQLSSRRPVHFVDPTTGKTVKGFFTKNDQYSNQSVRPEFKQIVRDKYGQDLNANINRRNNAMYEVANLLGEPNLIAKSVNMTLIDGDTTVHGSFMTNADGIDPRSINPNVPPFQGCGLKFTAQGYHELSKLQVMDYLCANVDRHSLNYFYKVQTVQHGNKKTIQVVGIQGIDNDMSFGTVSGDGDGLTKNMSNLGDIKYIDEKLANSIVNMKTDEFTAIMQKAGITGDQIKSAQHRLSNLQNAIVKNKITKIDNPEKWDKINKASFMTVHDKTGNIFMETSLVESDYSHRKPVDMSLRDKQTYRAPKPLDVSVSKTDMGKYHLQMHADRLDEIRGSLLAGTEKDHQNGPEYEAMFDALNKVSEMSRNLATKIDDPKTRVDMEYNKLSEAYKDLYACSKKYADTHGGFHRKMGAERLALSKELMTVAQFQRHAAMEDSTLATTGRLRNEAKALLVNYLKADNKLARAMAETYCKGHLNKNPDDPARQAKYGTPEAIEAKTKEYADSEIFNNMLKTCSVEGLKKIAPNPKDGSFNEKALRNFIGNYQRIEKDPKLLKQLNEDAASRTEPIVENSEKQVKNEKPEIKLP